MSSNREALNKIAVGRVARAVQAAAGGTAESDELDAVATEELRDSCAEVRSVGRMQRMLPAGAARAVAHHANRLAPVAAIAISSGGLGPSSRAVAHHANRSAQAATSRRSSRKSPSACRDESPLITHVPLAD